MKKAQISYLILFLSILVAGLIMISFAFWNLARETQRMKETGYEYIARQIAWRIDHVAFVKENITTTYQVPDVDCRIDLSYGRVLVEGVEEKGIALAYHNVNPMNITMLDAAGDPIDEMTCNSLIKIRNNITNIVVSYQVGSPELKISEDDLIFSDSHPKSGETVEISAIVHNIGTKDAEEVLVRFQRERENVKKLIGENTISVPKGEERKTSVQWETKSGEWLIKVKVDPNDKISESSESNNKASKKLPVVGPLWCDEATASCCCGICPLCWGCRECTVGGKCIGPDEPIPSCSVCCGWFCACGNPSVTADCYPSPKCQ